MSETSVHKVLVSACLLGQPVRYDGQSKGIVSNWPVSVDGARAVALGLPQPPPLKVIVEQYLEDFGKR